MKAIISFLTLVLLFVSLQSCGDNVVGPVKDNSSNNLIFSWDSISNLDNHNFSFEKDTSNTSFHNLKVSYSIVSEDSTTSYMWGLYVFYHTSQNDSMNTITYSSNNWKTGNYSYSFTNISYASNYHYLSFIGSVVSHYARYIKMYNIKLYSF